MFLKWENNNGKLQIIRGKLQNSAMNNVKQISQSHVIITWNYNGGLYYSFMIIVKWDS